MRTLDLNSGYFKTILFPLTLIFIFVGSCKKIDIVPRSDADSPSLSVVSSKPNIILILADDAGYEIPTCDGGQSYSTPNIDKMAAQGLRFTQCQGSPMCSPSRFMLMTGKYNFRNYTTWGMMDLSQRTIANVLRKGGYDTYAVGKWQFDGGDSAVHQFGFKKYIIFEPFKVGDSSRNDEDGETVGRYKNPSLYSNGEFLKKGATRNKYCDDILVDSLTSYAKKSSSKGTPFFIYYSMSLVHSPFSPTPDDPEFAAWDPKANISDTSFFPSMVKYMDKKVGEVISRMDSMGLLNNTIILFLGDNGTPHNIYSWYNNQLIEGGKMKTYTYGTHVPFVVYWKGRIVPGINNDLIDFTDFLPTLADVASVPIPSYCGIIDGTSFYPQLFNNTGNPRDWVFCHYDPDHFKPTPLKRFIYNDTYKLYDSTDKFYNMLQDPYETSAIKPRNMTIDEKQLHDYFQSILDTLH
jgi:arylsulfatase A